MAKTIRHTVEFHASPHEVFEALMNARKHAAFTGARAKIDRRVGGAFSVWDGYATGKTVKLEDDKVIVQSWRTTDFAEDDPDSKVMFHFSRKGKGTRLIFAHSDVPDKLAEDIAQGWIDFYWTPLKVYFAKTNRK